MALGAAGPTFQLLLVLSGLLLPPFLPVVWTGSPHSSDVQKGQRHLLQWCDYAESAEGEGCLQSAGWGRAKRNFLVYFPTCQTHWMVAARSSILDRPFPALVLSLPQKRHWNLCSPSRSLRPDTYVIPVSYPACSSSIPLTEASQLDTSCITSIYLPLFSFITSTLNPSYSLSLLWFLNTSIIGQLNRSAPFPLCVNLKTSCASCWSYFLKAKLHQFFQVFLTDYIL